MDNKEFIEALNGCADFLSRALDKTDSLIYDRIIFIGAHGTGKSTLAKELSSILSMPVVESVAREAAKDFKILENECMISSNIPERYRKNAYQKVLCSMSYWDFMRWVGAEVPCIMTRCPLDTIAYAMADDDITDHTTSECLKVLQEDDKFRKALESSLFVYLPIEFGIEDDGVRPTDVEFQSRVDEAMRKLMGMFGIPPQVVSGTVEERLNSILQHIVMRSLKKAIWGNGKN